MANDKTNYPNPDTNTIPGKNPPPAHGGENDLPGGTSIQPEAENDLKTTTEYGSDGNPAKKTTVKDNK